MLSRNRVHRFCAASGRQEQENTEKNATIGFVGQRVTKADEWDFSLMFSVDSTPSEIRSEVLVSFGAARQPSPEIFQRFHPKFFNSSQLFVGVLEDWSFSPGRISMLWYRSPLYFLFFHIFFPCH